MRQFQDHITIDKDIQNGRPVFAGTRVTVESFFWHLEKGVTIEEFIEDFPGVSHDQAVGVLEIINTIVGSSQLDKLYEAAN